MTDYKKKLYKKVSKFFNGDKEKVALWYETPNPMLGDIKPSIMIEYNAERAYRAFKTS